MFVSETLPDSRALAGLNEEQQAAAEHDGGHLLVLAGAGTGKTTTLCARVARLVERGVPHERILLLTFTRRAAREMVDRARAATGGGTRRVLGGTFHSVAHRLVREHAIALGLSPDFALLDSADAADVLDLVRQEHGHSDSVRRFPRKSTLIDIYSRTVNAQRPLREVLDEDFPWCAEHADALVGLFRGYTARKRALGMLDLDDLLVFWRALMVDPRAGAAVARGFDHVLVDEYQDVNRLQVEIVSGFAAGGCAVTAVGDDFQAIYGFRSASARFILGFSEQFADARTITLHRNYRATQPLLDVANAVSAQDTSGFPKRLVAQRDGGDPPALVYVRDQAHEAVVISDRVLAAREQGMLLREQAVLARTGHDTDLLELELSRRGIPYRKYGGLRYLDAAHVKDLAGELPPRRAPRRPARVVPHPAADRWRRAGARATGMRPAARRRSARASHARGALGRRRVRSCPHRPARRPMRSSPPSQRAATVTRRASSPSVCAMRSHRSSVRTTSTARYGSSISMCSAIWPAGRPTCAPSSPTSCSIRPRRRATSPGLRTSMTTGSSCRPSIRQRVSSGSPCT